MTNDCRHNQLGAKGRRCQLVTKFEKDGFLLIERLLHPAGLVAARAAVEWALQQPAEQYKWIRTRVQEHHLIHPIFLQLIEHDLVIQIAEMALGKGNFHLIAAQCSRNTNSEFYAPGADKLHQDGCFLPANSQMEPGRDRHQYGFSAMWYLQDTPLEMGPTELVRGSHLRTDGLDERSLSSGSLFSRAIPAGSLLIFKHCTWHRGVANRTAIPRDLVTNAYARRCIDRVQLKTPQSDGTQQYIVCKSLIPQAVAIRRQLFGIS